LENGSGNPAGERSAWPGISSRNQVRSGRIINGPALGWDGAELVTPGLEI